MEFGQKSVRLPKRPDERLRWRRAIVILEHCPIQSIQTKDGFELLRERHRMHHARTKSDPAQWRPDVVHQCLLHLLDSPLNRAGRLQIFIRTAAGILIQVDPRLHVPRSMRLFEAMMTRLLFKLKVRSVTNQLQLMRVVRNPVTVHLPDNTTYIRVERGGTLEDPVEFCTRLATTCGGVDPISGATQNRRAAAAGGDEESSADDDDDDDDDDADEDVDEDVAADSDEHNLPIWERGDDNRGGEANNMKPFAFVIGGMSRGDVEVDYCTDKNLTVSFSTRPMSAASICSMICHAFEASWLSHDYPHSMDSFS